MSESTMSGFSSSAEALPRKTICKCSAVFLCSAGSIQVHFFVAFLALRKLCSSYYFFDFWFNKFISIRIKICANAWTIFLVQKFPCGERFMLSSFMHKLEVKRNCLRWRCGSVIFVLTISLIWDVTRLLWSFEAKYPSPVILVFQKTMFYANRWLKIRIVSCERAFVTPGRNIGKLAAKSKEERTPSAMRPVGKYHNEKFESYLLL